MKMLALTEIKNFHHHHLSFFVPYPTFTHLNVTIIISIHISPLERTHGFSLLCEIMRPLTEEMLMQPEPLFFFFPPTDLCTDATAQQTAGAQPYQQAKEVPLLQTKAWQLTVMHRLDFSDNFLFAPPPPPFAILPHTWPTRDASWGEYKSLLWHIENVSEGSLWWDCPACPTVAECVYQWGH